MLLLSVLAGFVLAPFVPFIHRLSRDAIGWILAALPLALTIYFAGFYARVRDGEVISAAYEWVPSLGINLTFTLDSLSLIFALLVCGIGTLIFIYANGYLHGHAQIGRFYMALLMFMASMLGTVLADNIILLFIFWELTSLSSYLLISFYHEKLESREAAKTALLVTSIGGLAMLAGLVLLGILSNTWEFSGMIAAHDAIQAHDLYLPALILILVGAFSKSAQFPFHFWLPAAMEAPAPVSAYLHSATMVKAGVYLLMRLHPIMGKTDEWHLLVTLFGGITMLLGGYVAWQQTDIKRILAYTTISALGILVFLMGIGSGTAVKAALLFLVVHCLYKGALFMVGGAVDHETGSRDITQLGGLRSQMPFTFAAAVLAGLSMAGIPPLVGFIGKEVIYEAARHAEDMPVIILTAAAVLGNLFNVTAAGMVAVRPFFGENHETPKKAHEGPLSLWLSPALLGVGGLILGIFSTQLFKPLLTQSVEVVYGSAYELETVNFIDLLTHPGLSLLLSVITIALGIALYVRLDRLRAAAAPFDLGQRIGTAQDGYNFLMNDVILGVGNWQAALLAKSRLRHYIRVIVIAFLSVVLSIMAAESDLDLSHLEIPDIRFIEAALLVVIIIGALAVTQARSRLAAVASLGAVGYGVALIFVLFGAPDLAMTQFSIETLAVILFVLVIYRLPTLQLHSDHRARGLDAAIAVISGVTITMLVLIITSEPLQSHLTPFFAEYTYLLAKGHNVVNVILVDFRGFDTMGEITVLSVAAIGVFALLNLNLNKPKDDE